MVSALDHVFRDQWGRVLAALIGFLGDFELDHVHYLHAARGELLARCGAVDAARAAYDRALALVVDEPERRRLARRRAALVTCACPGRQGR